VGGDKQKSFEKGPWALFSPKRDGRQNDVLGQGSEHFIFVDICLLPGTVYRTKLVNQDADADDPSSKSPSKLE
jgi:hypothetical protein